MIFYDVYIVDTHVLFEVESESGHNVSCTLVYYQVGKKTIDSNLNLSLIYYIISKRYPQYFNNIEYIDKTYVTLHEGGTRGLIIAIESFTDPYIIQRHIQEFISYILVIIKRFHNNNM